MLVLVGDEQGGVIVVEVLENHLRFFNDFALKQSIFLGSILSTAQRPPIKFLLELDHTTTTLALLNFHDALCAVTDC
jgi:hypothetical protein